MMKRNKIVKTITILTLIALFLPIMPVMAEETVEKSGPWAEELIFKIYLNPEAEFLALKTGEINIMDWELQPDDVPDALADPNLETASAPDLGYYLIDINCQRWPTSDVHFRRALAHLVDKPRIVTDVMQGFGYVLDSPVPSIMGGWSNPDIRTYEFNSELAAAELDLGGFTDTDADGIRNDPITGENMAPVIFYIRLDDPNRKQAGEWLAAELKALGVPVEGELALERSVCGDAVFYSSTGEWNVYTGGWGLGYRPTHLADFYHSREFDPELETGWRGYNYPGFVNSTFDYWADLIKSASTFEDVKEAAYICQEIIAEQVPGIPMYGFVGVKSYSSEWTGLINAVDGGIKHWHSILNMHPKDQAWGGRIEYGVKSDIETLNPMTANWEYTWEVLDKIYESPFITNPLDFSENWGWLAESWDIEDWTSPTDVPGIKITFHFVENAKWHDDTPFTAEDLKFTYEYIQEQGIPMFLTDLRWIEDLVVVDDYTLEVYQNTTSYFALNYINVVPIVPKHIWEDVGDDWQDYDPVAEGEVIGLGPWKYVDSVAGEYYLFEANEDYFKFPTIAKQAYEISTLEDQLAEAALISGEAAEDIAALSAQLSTLESSTRQLLEASADDIESLSSEITTLLSDISGFETEISSLKSGLSSASNIGYASIGIAILVGAVAIFMSRRET
jgi:ABC-type transport system substrate-binding protein